MGVETMAARDRFVPKVPDGLAIEDEDENERETPPDHEDARDDGNDMDGPSRKQPVVEEEDGQLRRRHGNRKQDLKCQTGLTKHRLQPLAGHASGSARLPFQ